jgi:hypothetical protein
MVCRTTRGYYEPIMMMILRASKGPSMMMVRRRRSLGLKRTHVLGPQTIVYSRKSDKAWCDGADAMFELAPAIAGPLAAPTLAPSSFLHLHPIALSLSSLFLRPFLEVGPRRAR